MNAPVPAPIPTVFIEYCAKCDRDTAHVIKPGPNATECQCQECLYSEVIQTGGKSK